MIGSRRHVDGASACVDCRASVIISLLETTTTVVVISHTIGAESREGCDQLSHNCLPLYSHSHFGISRYQILRDNLTRV